MNPSGTVSQPLPAGIVALDAAAIAARLVHADFRPRVVFETVSTNSQLAEDLKRGQQEPVLLAEYQSAGRGRRGRGWLSPPGRGLYLSLAWTSRRPLRELGALSLVAGLAAARATAQTCQVRVGLKWPNDLQIEGRKLGGCLIDLATVGPGCVRAIIGLGLNVDFTGLEGPDQAWTDLASHTSAPDRNDLAARLIDQLIDHLQRFEQHGFPIFAECWRAHDVLHGREVSLIDQNSACRSGRAAGVDAQGRLQFETAEGTMAISSGEVSLRPAATPLTHA